MDYLRLSLILLACLAFNYANAQQNSISGKVVDGGGLPIPGVNVVIKEYKVHKF
jgi:hypothetical protein